MEQLYRGVSELSLNEYPDIVEDAQTHRAPSGAPSKLRIHIVDGLGQGWMGRLEGAMFLVRHKRGSQASLGDCWGPLRCYLACSGVAGLEKRGEIRVLRPTTPNY